jgi:hypothetical protein
MLAECNCNHLHPGLAAVGSFHRVNGMHPVNSIELYKLRNSTNIDGIQLGYTNQVSICAGGIAGSCGRVLDADEVLKIPSHWPGSLAADRRTRLDLHSCLRNSTASAARMLSS